MSFHSHHSQSRKRSHHQSHTSTEESSTGSSPSIPDEGIFMINGGYANNGCSVNGHHYKPSCLGPPQGQQAVQSSEQAFKRLKLQGSEEEENNIFECCMSGDYDSSSSKVMQHTSYQTHPQEQLLQQNLHYHNNNNNIVHSASYATIEESIQPPQQQFHTNVQVDNPNKAHDYSNVNSVLQMLHLERRRMRSQQQQQHR